MVPWWGLHGPAPCFKKGGSTIVSIVNSWPTHGIKTDEPYRLNTDLADEMDVGDDIILRGSYSVPLKNAVVVLLPSLS